MIEIIHGSGRTRMTIFVG